VARQTGLPKWLTILLVVVGVVVLGPPALALLLAALGIAFSVTAGVLKLGVIALIVYAAVMLIQAVFGKSSARSASPRLDTLAHNIEAADRMDAERRALDEELARAVAATRK
jgi:hypothetical protein